MQEFSKYKAITIGFILMFIFVVAAIYTNTKDAAIKKMQMENNTNQQQIDNIEFSKNSKGENLISKGSGIDIGSNDKILEMSDRIDNLEKAVFAPKASDTGVRCSIRGYMDDGNVIEASDEEAIRESKTNNKEVLITCIFK